MTLVTERSVNLSSCIGPLNPGRCNLRFFMRVRRPNHDGYEFLSLSRKDYLEGAVHGSYPHAVIVAQYRYTDFDTLSLLPTRLGTNRLKRSFSEIH